GFLDRAWRMIIDERAETLTLAPAVQRVEMTPEQTRVLHRTIKAVTHDTESLNYNTAIARMMEFVNFFTKQSVRPHHAMEQFVLLISPYAPHFAEQLWLALGHSDTLAYEAWPEYDEALTIEESVEVPVQINGKLRTRITVARGSANDDLLAAARSDPRIAELLTGKVIRKTVVIPD